MKELKDYSMDMLTQLMEDTQFQLQKLETFHDKLLIEIIGRLTEEEKENLKKLVK